MYVHTLCTGGNVKMRAKVEKRTKKQKREEEEKKKHETLRQRTKR